ncbi:MULTISPECIES: siderophore-iron reductase FhuF [Halomonadaceae]|jgi:ferric iron reductase protein FhuF|uniref:siderophore-iron reductase FhuF n=1 Tax=Halomonadaceae TaxID=28256 RepID=UPI000586B905|nr:MULTISPECIES: siderophore-iron reductase FhuF [Halomonas]NVE90747.1 siderophore-iron reductase FhuF [Halomonas titanicae]CAD5273815.1 Siderophore-iron reductase FhuF [Halomonas sp. 156]CAD5277649.1 Siderophore-iron reductase FhuF [Halomonas sp. 113]CAD5278988.1 Siderophore-iron reductase FhuF [Halomonas sp. 59]CAD5284878.1 Ferric reductase [Halomonas sp. I3]|tara:strand:- start:531 stop:1319 length:789 start_codon:yes stop_codon:yes gene_type:complete
MSNVAIKTRELWAAANPAEALLALYRQPPLDNLKAPAFGQPDEPTLAASALLDRDFLSEQLARYGRSHGEDADRKAVASIWSKYHFSSVSIPTLVANLLLGYALPVSINELRLALGDKGQTGRIWLPHGGIPLSSQAPQARFSTLFDDHCAPLIEALAAVSGLSTKVFWSNLGAYVEFVGKTCSRLPEFSGAGDPLLDYLDTKTLPDGRRNPLYQPVRYLELGGETPARVRRLCCIKYRLPGEPLCGGCPLKPENKPAKRRS